MTEHAAPQNLLRITDRIYSGGTPEGAQALASLERLGVKTLVSVDAARPDLETARLHGLRYVHIPIGYDGVDREAGLSLARLVRDGKGPFYIHCHHGRHRGPVAAAIAALASGDIDRQGALKTLQLAGTSKNYTGLWRAVEAYHPPAVDVELPELVEVAQVASLAAAMAKIDNAFDGVQQCRDAHWTPPENHPDLIPYQQALLLKEGLREARRGLSDQFPPQFQTWLADAERLAQCIEDALTTGKTKQASKLLQTLKRACTDCHQKYRDGTQR